MNERIRELAEQAGIVFWEISGDVDWRQANRENLEKFAELIYKDVITVVAAQALLNESAMDVFKNLKRIYEEAEE